MIYATDLLACRRCQHHVQRPGEPLQCECPTVAGALRTVPCEQARFGDVGGLPGNCGRDAHHMLWMPARHAQQTLPWASA